MESGESIISRDDRVETVACEQEEEMDICDLFPVIQVPETALQRYRKVPVTGLAALGAAFSQLPDAARTIVRTTTTGVDSDATLFVGINPKGIPGYLIENQYGTDGNIMQINEQGKRIIAGRMRFKPVDSTLPVKETVQTTTPYDPTLMIIAVAIMEINKKLDKLQSSVDAVLKFLELEKQAKQRGNLRKLAEIADDYKVKCEDKDFCTNRNFIVQKIQLEAMGDVEFYQSRVGTELANQKALHINREATALIGSVTREFAEYQLACYLYAYSCFLDVMLRRDFSKITLDKAVEKLKRVSDRYDDLYTKCRSQIAQYQRSALEAKVVGNIGMAAKGLGKAIGSIPVIKEGPVDEALISAGIYLGRKNRDTVENSVNTLAAFEDDRMSAFIEGLTSVNLMYNTENSMITDGENIYVLSMA